MCPQNSLETRDPARSLWWSDGHKFRKFSKKPVVGPPSWWTNVVWWKYSFFVGTSTTVVATQNVTEDPPPVTVNFRFPIAPAPIRVAMAALPAPLPARAVATAPALMAPDTADVEAPEPQVLERPYFPTRDAHFSDSSDDSSTNDASLHARTLRDTPTYMNSGEQKLPAEAIPTDRESPLRPLSPSQSSHAISGAGSNNSLNESPRSLSNTFEFEEGQLLDSPSSESMPHIDQGNLRLFPTSLSHSADSHSSIDTTREHSIFLRNFRTTVTRESQQAHSSSTVLPKSYDLRPRLPPRDCPEKVIQNNIPPTMRCIPITEPAALSNQLTQSQKRDVIIDSCQRTWNLQSNSDVHKNPYVHKTYTSFRHSAHSTPPGYSVRQKEVKKRYFWKTSRNAHQNIMMSMQSLNQVYIQNFVSHSHILTASTCVAHCVSSDFAMGKGFASAIACCYPELQELKITNDFPPGALVTYFDQQHHRFIYNSVTKRRFFKNLPTEHLNWVSKS